MTKNLALENLAEYLILAYNYDEATFKRRVIDFVKKQQFKNTHYLVTSKEWHDFTNRDWELSKKILDDIYA
jgi:hypothetical protein